MKHFKSIPDYCNAINIPAPQYPFFDIRSFEENMPTVVQNMPPFKHEFYAVAIKVEGSGKAISGVYKDFPDGATVFFNSPFQILSWDIFLDWTGYYIMFSKEFLTKSRHLRTILSEFQFFKIDKTIPFVVAPNEVKKLLETFEAIHEENRKKEKDSIQIIEAHVLVLLNYVKRYFEKQFSEVEAEQAFRKADLNLLSRFQTLIETSFYQDASHSKKTHSPGFYASQLAVHPNHLNATVKQITGHTAKKHIQNHILRLAKSRLIQTDLSVKEIAYDLHFDSPNSFTTFFKKQAGETPISFRKKQ